MADFTINSLSSSIPVSTDTFLKSDTNGVLTKVTYANIVNQEDITTSVTDVTNVSSKKLYKKGNMYHLEMTISPGINQLVNVADIPNDIVPVQRLPLAYCFSSVQDNGKVIGAFVDGIDIYIFTSSATVGNIYVSGSWVKD